MSEDEIELARRAELSPESLTEDEIRQLGVLIMRELFDAGEGLRPERPNTN